MQMELNPSIETRDVLFESQNSNNGNSDSPQFNLAFLNLNDVVGMQFLFANVPFVYNVVDATNNQFYLKDANNSSGNGKLVTLPVGTYNSTQWPFIFSQALSTAGVTGYADYVSYYDTVTNQIVIVNNNATSITFTITTTLAATANSIANNDTFGFNYGTFTASLAAAGGLLYNGSLDSAPFTTSSQRYYITSQYTASLSGPNEMYLHSNLAAQFNSVYDTIVPAGTGDVLAFWPINTVNSGSINFSPPFETILKGGQPKKISDATFYLTIGTQTKYSGVTQYGSALQTGQGNDLTVLPYLPLGGTSWQVGIRFYIQTSQINSVGNGAGTTSTSYGSGSQIRTTTTAPQPFKRSRFDAFGGKNVF
jgi:hypothetical protein